METGVIDTEMGVIGTGSGPGTSNEPCLGLLLAPGRLTDRRNTMGLDLNEELFGA